MNNIHFHPTKKLGLKPVNPKRLHVPLGAFLTKGVTPQFPARFDLTTHFPGDGHAAPMGGNDTVGDCADVAQINYLRTANADAGRIVTFADPKDYIGLYSATTGYDPSQGNGEQNPTDQGSDVDALLDYMTDTGWMGHKYDAHASVSPQNSDHVKSTIYSLGGVILGVNLPRKVFDMGKRWDVPVDFDDQNDLIGGHCIYGCAYGQIEGLPQATGDSLFIYSWGDFIEMTPAFRDRYCFMARAILAKDYLGVGNRAFNGLDYQGLVNAFQNLKG